MSTKIKFFIAFVLLAFSTWFYFTLHRAVGEMKSAAQAKDAAKLSSYVNFLTPLVKPSTPSSQRPTHVQ